MHDITGLFSKDDGVSVQSSAQLPLAAQQTKNGRLCMVKDCIGQQRHRLCLAKAKFLLRANKMQLVHSRPPLSENFLFFISSNAEEVLVAMSSSSPYDIDRAPASVLSLFIT